MNKVRKTLKYLLFHRADENERLANFIYSEEYKINMAGKSTATELFGWAKADEKPILNERTAKSMQWLGFGRI
jgi:hypothetical protein